MKNPNGSGSVYKLPGNRRKKWIAVKTTSWQGGKQKRVIVGYFEEKTEAVNALGRFEYNPHAKITFKEVYELWSKRHFEKVKNTTAYQIKSIYINHLSKLDNERIADLKIGILQVFFDKMNLSRGTLKGIKSTLSMIFQYAMKNEFITKNPVPFIELKKFEPVIQRRVFTADEIQKLWDNVNVPFVDSILIMIYSSLRVNEFLSLRNEDIEIDDNIKLINIKDSKTEAGIRKIPVHDRILPLLINKMKNSNGLLTKNGRGKKYQYSFYRIEFLKALEKVGIEKKHTIHDCRHTTATLLSNAGADPVSIAKIMGHTSYSNMTAKVYTHKDNKELKKAISTLN